MRALSATSVLVILVIGTAESLEPRWSRPDDDREQGDWVPLKSERLSQQPLRIPSAISSPRQEHSFPLPSGTTNQFAIEYQKQHMLGSHPSPQRVAFVNPQNLNQQHLIQPQLQSQLDQQLLAQFLNQQIQQASLPTYNRPLLQKQPIPDPHYYNQPSQFTIVPMYNQGQLLQNEQYRYSDNRELEGKLLNKDGTRQINVDNSYIKNSQPKNVGENFNTNLEDSNQKEEIQILYVPVEMLRQQEQNARNKAQKGSEVSQPSTKEVYNTQLTQQNAEIPLVNQKDSRKFRHPIQPLKEQSPAYHLKQPITQTKGSYSTSETENDDVKARKPSNPSQEYINQKTFSPPRGEYVPKYDTVNSNIAPSYPRSPTKEQSVESTVQDEVSNYRNVGQEKRIHNDYINKPEASLPPPNQPPLSVFMEKVPNYQIGDIIGLLRGSKTIPVLDSIGPDSPQVFVGPSNLNTPAGYLKFELPYLSSLDKKAGNKLSQVPFFVAPLNFQPPPGFAKIPFPPPHIGSVVLSNITQSVPHNDNPTPSNYRPDNPELRTTSYKETFTIPADISSISPQLPSLINSLQEEEYSGSSSTETLNESTEVTPSKQRRPSGSRRFNSRGSQRGTVSYASTTRRPTSSRQRKPYNRNNDQRNNYHSEARTNTPEASVENQYESDPNYFQYKANKDSSESNEGSSVEQKINDTPQVNNEERQHGIQYTGSLQQAKQEEGQRGSGKHDFVNHNPAFNPTDDVPTSNSDKTLSGSYYTQESLSKHLAHQSSPTIQNAKASGESYDYSTEKPTRSNLTPTEKQYQLVSTTSRNDDAPILYHSGTHNPLGYTEDSSGGNIYDEENYKKRFRDNPTALPPTGTDQYWKYRQQAEKTVTPQIIQENEYSKVAFDPATVYLQSREQERPSHHQSTEELKNLKSPYSSYTVDPNEQTTPYIQKSNLDLAGQFKQQQDTLSDTEPKSYSPQTSPVTSEEYSGKTIYDQTNSEEQKPVTDRPIPTRTRSRGRGRPYNYKQASTESSGGTNNSDESNYGSHHSKTDATTTTSPGRRYYAGRTHRRPLRPTTSTTTAASVTTTTAPPGTKYLIRTRKPTVAHTKLHTGRGRIRRPTTPTTTVATTTTVEYQQQTLPLLWQHHHRLSPNQNDYRSKENVKQTQAGVVESAEYTEENPPYKYERTIYESQNGQKVDYNQAKLRQYTDSELPKRIPSHLYDSQNENIQSQKQYPSAQAPHYVNDYEATPKTNYRNHEASQKQDYLRNYETTQKPQYFKEYDTTQRGQYIAEYETTQKPHYGRDYETTPKQQYIRDYETTRKSPQYFKEYDTTPSSTHFKNQDTTQNSKLYDQYETAKKVSSTGEYDFTEKPQYYKDYQTTKKVVAYQDYQTTPRSYTVDSDSQQQTPHNSRQSYRTTSHRRKPATVTSRGESKHVKNVNVEAPAKNADNDFWNQAVTIQQSQSYVFNPEETYSDEKQVNSPADSKFESTQIDYEDYFNSQGSEQYTSDQSPYPSNEQKITYTKVKPADDIGKANQYPNKEVQVSSYAGESGVKEENIQENESPETDVKPTEQIAYQHFEKNETSLPEKEAYQHAIRPIQGNKRRGAWVRRRVKKPIDLFETAESQRFSSVRENSLVPEENLKESKRNNITKDQNITKETLKTTDENYTPLNNKSDEKENTNSELTTVPFVQVTLAEEQEKESPGKSNEIIIIKEITTELTETTTDDPYTTPSITTLSPNTEAVTATSEPYRTSTTTEISHETEICYKGQCIKTKRKKQSDEFKI